MIYFQAWVALKHLARITFRDPAVLKYSKRTCFRESRKVANIYHVEYTSSDR